MTLVAGPVGSESGTALPHPATRPAQQSHEFLDRLEGLAAELGRRGLQARLVTPDGRIPSLHVANPLTSRLAEDVYVGRSQDDLWWFWWPWAERIARDDELGEAAMIIARVLSTGTDSA
ncbi:MAG TPA: hypothetical protein VFI65_05875 [Streptosporangiaceae bacterium]|nr:hypothetical protein [Streptosporangiaceae bacterium]